MFLLTLFWTIFIALGMVATVWYIDRPRPTITHGVAIFTVICNAALIFSLWTLYNHTV